MYMDTVVYSEFQNSKTTSQNVKINLFKTNKNKRIDRFYFLINSQINIILYCIEITIYTYPVYVHIH